MTDHLSQVQIPITTGEGILKGHGSASQQQKDLWHTCIREMMPNGIALSKQWQREIKENGIDFNIKASKKLIGDT